MREDVLPNLQTNKHTLVSNKVVATALDVWPAFLTLYTLFLATSFAFLFICLFLSMKYQARMNEYNIYKADQVYVCGDKHESFESYYACHCAGPARIATYLFYVGTLMLLVAAALLQVENRKSLVSFPSIQPFLLHSLVAGI